MSSQGREPQKVKGIAGTAGFPPANAPRARSLLGMARNSFSRFALICGRDARGPNKSLDLCWRDARGSQFRSQT